ncbi:MAG: cation:proton antiporter [Brevinematales bacterium]|nr:cation:proton antiporter [Brevinematales bacterium]
MLNILVILIIVGGWMGGRFFRFLKLPAPIGMLCWGILLGTLIRSGWASFLLAGEGLDILKKTEPFLKSLALVIILLRGGLGIQREALHRHGWSAFFLSWVPAVFEMVGLLFLLHSLLGFSWPMAFLTSCILSAVSLAVVVPSMLELKHAGIGKKKDIPTMILAATSLDNVVAVTLFSLALSMARGVTTGIFSMAWILPWSVGLGGLLGLLVGWVLSSYLEKRYTNIRATEKSLLILMMALMSMQVGDTLHASALVTVVMIGFILLERAPRVAHEVARKLNTLWVASEIVLFVLVGMAVDPSQIFRLGIVGIVIIMGGLIFRSMGVLVATAKTSCHWKERLFCIISFLPKATVQAALGSVPLAYGLPGGDTILALAVTAILVTSPLGAFLIERFSRPLLDVDLRSLKESL